MNVRFLEVARQELDEAVRYHDAESSGLGAVCLSEMLSAIGRITRYPEAWPLLRGGLRRCRTRRFPYGLMYCADGDEIVIVAIADLHREPTYWRYRMRADTDR